MPSDRPTKSHGTFDPATVISRILTGAGYPSFAVRRGSGFGGHRCRWDGVRKVVQITYWASDSTPDSLRDVERAEMLDGYTEILTEKGKRVERTADGRMLIVHV